MDEALPVPRKNSEAEIAELVERNTKTTHVKQTESTTKDYVIKGILPLPRQPTKHPASGRVGIKTDLKRLWYQMKSKLDEINETQNQRWRTFQLVANK